MPNRIVWIALIAVTTMTSAASAQRPFPSPETPFGMRYELGSKRFQQVRDLTLGTIVTHPAEQLPADAKTLVTGFDSESTAIRQRAEQEIQAKRLALINALQALQDTYTREAKLDEAVTIRNTIRQLKVAHLKPLPDPGTLSEYANRVGESFYFDVTGQVGYSVWGSEVYTCDSHLATAAVHAGVLNVGQQGIVKVTIIKSPESHQGSTAHGVTTSSWGSYSSSYTVERPNVDGLPPLKQKP